MMKVAKTSAGRLRAMAGIRGADGVKNRLLYLYGLR